MTDKETDISRTSPHGIDRTLMDPSVSPADDFFRYAGGGWMDAHPLTGEYSRYGMFDALRENNRLQLKELIVGLADTPQAGQEGTNAQKVSDLYRMALDMERRNAEGAAPLMGQIERINAMTEADFTDILSWLHAGIASPFFGTGVGADPKDSDMNIMYVGEGGLSLGDRDYYLEKNETNDRIMDAFRVYVMRLMELIGYDTEAQQRVWDNLIAIETEMARHTMTREQRRDPLLRYNMRTFAELEKECPAICWKGYFEALGLPEVDKVNVSSPQYLQWLSGALPSMSLQAVKDYMTFCAADQATGLLSDDFFNASFDFFGRVMSGKTEPEPLWKRAMGLPGSILGEAVGQLYVEKYFPPCNKEYMLSLVENLRRALGKHISALSWMSPATKAKALEKLAAITVKIGYPDKWKDYSGIRVDSRLSLLENVLAASRWYVADNYSKLGKPVDKSEWHMTPQTVNAYYSPVNNEICFPAGILQAPYFDITADSSLNYGSIGVVIGHEMTHGFDDQGRHFDKDGNLAEWWSDSDAEEFRKLSDGLAAQFDAVEVLPGLHANGRYTLGENIADQGGLRIALTAWLDAEKESGDTPRDIDGLPPLQRFYIAYAQLWADNIRDEEIEVRTKTDPHSLGRWRVNATLPNITPFLEAFSITEGHRMYRRPEDRIIIW